MAHDEGSDGAAARQSLDARIRRLRESREADRNERRLRAEALGRQLEDQVEGTLARFADDLRRPLKSSRPPVKPRDSRAANWKGPHSGRRYRDPAALKQATLEECAAGFAATWGYAMTDQERSVFSVVVNPDPSFAIEQASRIAYTNLRKAIDAASELAGRYYNQTCGSATVALGHLWGCLPTLPVVTDLPGYDKARPARRVLIEQWQTIAAQQLGRMLAPRELAELSILLGVGPPQGYRQFFEKKGADAVELAVSPATVLDAEAKRLGRFSRSPPGPNP